MADSNRFTGYAVFDLETTGLFSGRHDRVIEIGIVRLDEDLEVVEEWETLIDPDRDIGLTDRHGIYSADVKGAPTFTQLSADIWHRFESAIPVAHNLTFDRRFILAELSRAGINLTDFGGICTMRLADQLGLAEGHRKLDDLCRHLGIATKEAHSAGNDAWMCAEVLKKLAQHADLTSLATPVSCRELWARPATPRGLTRQKARERPIESPLMRVATRISSTNIKSSASRGVLDEYLLVLDRVLEDRVVTPEEADELMQVAMDFGLTENDCANVHRGYVEALIGDILSDGVITKDEERDLERTAALLRVDQVFIESRLLGQLTPHAIPREDLAGKSVCFTGELNCRVAGERISRHDAEELARKAGLVPAPRVTKTLDILVVADPDSASGKAKKARDYGVRIIAERSFWHKIGVEVG